MTPAVILHPAPIEATGESEPHETYSFLGCSRLAETIDRLKVSVVLDGHAHHGRYAAGRREASPSIPWRFSSRSRPVGRMRCSTSEAVTGLPD